MMNCLGFKEGDSVKIKPYGVISDDLDDGDYCPVTGIDFNHRDMRDFCGGLYKVHSVENYDGYPVYHVAPLNYTESNSDWIESTVSDYIWSYRWIEVISIIPEELFCV